jgi:exodeoxyribonuclease V beta subunit
MMVRAHRPDALPAADERYVVVEASAGTGKTYFLEHRVVDLVLAGAALDQILLVTFTDKAVAELRLRIRDLLDRLARQAVDTAAPGAPCWELDDDARARLRAAVTAFDRAPIFTIHGYCHRVLVEDAFAARRLFEQTQVADEVAFDAAFGAVLRERFAREPEDRALLGAYLESGRSVDDLRGLLLRCARTHAERRAHVDPAALAALAAGLREQFGTPDARDRATAALDRYGRASWADAIGEAIAALPDDAPTPALLAAFDAARDDAEKILKRLVAHAPAALGALLRQVIACPSLAEATAAAFLPPVLARVAEDKAEHGLFDYDDMLALVWATLRGDRGDELAERLRSRTPWVMIDEFQDTDPVQWNIFRRVWLHDDARGLVIVGDPKQAIYAFRGADVATYLRARDELARGGARSIALATNRRSTDALVAAVNELLAGSGEPLLQGAITYDRPVDACGELAADGVPPITAFTITGRSGLTGTGSADAVRDALAGAIGAEIERLRASPPRWQRRGVEPPFALEQVLVLTRGNKESAEIAAALRARGLACALVEDDHLFETREAAELWAVLAAIAAPRDRSARMRALRTRFFDVPWTDLMRVVDAPDHHPLIARLFDWAQLAARRAYEPLFRRLVEDSGFAERALVLGGGERALTNTWHLLELLLEEVSRARGDLHELVGALRHWIDDRTERTDDRDVQRAETDGDAIRVMTMHKAKGLEAPFVFVFGGIGKTPPGVRVQALRDADGRRLVVDPKDPALVTRLDAELEAEHQRLAYVALTRAQVQLYLPVYAERDVKGKMYAPIQRCLAPLVARGRVPAIAVPVDAPAAPAAPADALAGFAAPPAPPRVERPPLPAARAGLAMLSYTRLAHDLDAVSLAGGAGALAIDPAEFDGDTPGGDVLPGELPAGLASGLLLHDVLETVDLEAVRAAPDADAWGAAPEVDALLRDAARARGIAAEYLPHARRLVHATLTAPLDLAGGDALLPLAAAPHLAREVEFAYPVPGATPARGLVRGFIDALVAWDDELWVVDYKSDALDRGRLAAAARARVAERYLVQARLYAIAADRLRGARRLGGLVFAFVRHGIAVKVPTTDDAIAEWTAWLAGLRGAA